MSSFNLVPWREQRRLKRVRSWQWGFLVSSWVALGAVVMLDHRWDEWMSEQQAHRQGLAQTMAQWQTELTQAAVWQSRWHMAQQVQADWAGWRRQQTQAWLAMQQWMSVPPRGVQIERLVWRDHHWQAHGWALSTGHWQQWQTAMAEAGLSPQPTQAQWSDAQWRHTEGWAAKQHPFQLTLAPLTAVDRP